MGRICCVCFPSATRYIRGGRGKEKSGGNREMEGESKEREEREERRKGKCVEMEE